MNRLARATTILEPRFSFHAEIANPHHPSSESLGDFRYHCILQHSASATTNRSRSSAVWLVDRLILNRHVPSGTVGGRMAGT